MMHCTGLIACYDLFVFGLRSTEDVKRVKFSSRHQWDWDAGWQCTDFRGGRCKLAGVKKGTRPWKIWRTCHCPGNHVRPPAMFAVGRDGNPTSNLGWCSTCPVAVLEFLFAMQWQSQKRVYPKWLLKSGRLGDSNVNDVAAHAIQWMHYQFENEIANRPFDRNSGRKSLARWCSYLNIPYEESLQIHGDLPDVWNESYQKDMPKTSCRERSQSADPLVATKALRRFANMLNRGIKAKPKLSRSDRLASDDCFCSCDFTFSSDSTC